MKPFRQSLLKHLQFDKRWGVMKQRACNHPGACADSTLVHERIKLRAGLGRQASLYSSGSGYAILQEAYGPKTKVDMVLETYFLTSEHTGSSSRNNNNNYNHIVIFTAICTHIYIYIHTYIHTGIYMYIYKYMHIKRVYGPSGTQNQSHPQRVI